jgi:hypothetical protein
MGYGGSIRNVVLAGPPDDSGGASRFFPQFSGEAEMIEWFVRLLGGDGVFVAVSG